MRIQRRWPKGRVQAAPIIEVSPPSVEQFSHPPVSELIVERFQIKAFEEVRTTKFQLELAQYEFLCRAPVRTRVIGAARLPLHALLNAEPPPAWARNNSTIPLVRS